MSWFKKLFGKKQEVEEKKAATILTNSIGMKLQPIEEEDESEAVDAPDILTNSIGTKLKLIPAGTFMMGSNEKDYEKPIHQVTITKPFYLGVYQVTQKEWQAVMGNNPSKFKGRNRPVEQVSWDDCQEFCRKLSQKEGVTYRLPTEAEWEYACRAGTKKRYYWGNDFNGDYAWWHDNSGGQTHDVGTRKPNAWGLHDMIGNVWEWCNDWCEGDYYQYCVDNNIVDDPQGPDTGSYRVLRGGSWNNNPNNLCKVSDLYNKFMAKVAGLSLAGPDVAPGKS